MVGLAPKNGYSEETIRPTIILVIGNHFKSGYMSVSETIKAYGLRFIWIIVAAYLGSILGALAYGRTFVLGWHEVSPIGLVATIGMAAFTPVVNMFLLLAVIYSIFLTFFRWSLWNYSFVTISFGIVAYALRVAWRV